MPQQLDYSDAMPIAEFARRLGVARDTVYSWIYHGVKLPGGGAVKLGAVRVGGRFRVTPAEAERFLDALNPARRAEAAGEDAGMIERADAAARRLGWD